MFFLNNREEGMVFFLSPLQSTVIELYKYVRGCVSLKTYKSQGKAVEMIVNNKEENSFVWISPKNWFRKNYLRLDA